MVAVMRSAELMTIDGAGFDATDAFATQIARACTRFLKGR